MMRNKRCVGSVYPATDTAFQIGYYAEGNKKFFISSKNQLAEAFAGGSTERRSERFFEQKEKR